MTETTPRPTIRIALTPEQMEQCRQASGQMISSLALTPDLELLVSERPVARRIRACRWSWAVLAPAEGAGDGTGPGQPGEGGRRSSMAGRETLIERAMGFPMEDVVERHARDLELPMEVAREHERELKRFLALRALNPEVRYGMAGPVDELWHTFVIFTMRYAAFCQEVAGRFIWHVPAVGDEEQAERLVGYQRFLKDYEVTYGQPPPEHLWPRPNLNSDT